MPQQDLTRLERFWNCRLTTRGRKSGLPRRVTIWFALSPGCVYLTGGAEEPQWCRNLRANDRVELGIGGERLTGRARVVEDLEEARAIRERFVSRYLLARLARPFGGYTTSTPVVVEID